MSSMRIEQEIVLLKKSYTCLIVTHNIQQAIRIADNVLFVSEGELVESGSAQEIFESPKKPSPRHSLRDPCNLGNTITH